MLKNLQTNTKNRKGGTAPLFTDNAPAHLSKI